MIKKNINIGGYQYYTEMYDSDIDLASNPHYETFVMLRIFDIVNDVVEDKDIYFIESNLFNEICDEFEYNENEITNKIVWPIPDSANNGFSKSSIGFSDDITSDTIRYSYYNLYDETGKKLKKIKCNKLRIYHPLHRKKLNSIIYIENYINSVHFHYLCKRYDSFEPKTETEIRKNYEIYSEFIEIWYPNVYSLFKQSLRDEDTFDVYYEENLSIVTAPKSTEYINRISKYITENEIESLDELKRAENIVENELVNDAKKITEDLGDNPIDDLYTSNVVNLENDVKTEKDNYGMITRQLVPLALMIQPYRVIELTEVDEETGDESPAYYPNGDIMYCKLYLKKVKTIENNYITWPINVTIFPYSSIDDDGTYSADNNLESDTETYITPCEFKLCAKLGFSEGVLSLISTFDYPNKDIFIKKYNNLSDKDKTNFTPVALAYLYYNNLNPIEYNKVFSSSAGRKMMQEIDLIKKLTDLDKQQLYDYYGEIKYRQMQVNFNEMLTAYKDMKKKAILEELEDNNRETEMDFIGFSIRIYTDEFQKNIIYQNNISVDIGADINNPAFKLDDFAFKLNDIFNDWTQLPEKLYIKSAFIDKYIGLMLISNFTVITKEWFKYFMVENIQSYNKLNKLFEKNNNMKVIDIDSDKTNINFINNITCVVNKSTSESINLGRVQNKQRALLKPYFYRVGDLQNLRIRYGMSQNIGVNLADYMTKVETFHMIIDGNDFTEYGRNDIYVIFYIEAGKISNSTGYYDIADQDGTYISTGTYTIYG